MDPTTKQELELQTKTANEVYLRTSAQNEVMTVITSSLKQQSVSSTANQPNYSPSTGADNAHASDLLLFIFSSLGLEEIGMGFKLQEQGEQKSRYQHRATDLEHQVADVHNQQDDGGSTRDQQETLARVGVARWSIGIPQGIQSTVNRKRL